MRQGGRAPAGDQGLDMITFDGVTKRYAGGTVAVDDLSLEAPTGEITVFVGPSGCGKTTSLRMINRMVDPTGGRVLLDGADVTTIDPPTLRRGIGYVIQQAGLFPHRKVVDNVATVPRLLGWDRRRARSRAMELLERVGLEAALADRYPFQLSGGQQQRVGVARALAADPPVLLMDEPFSAVDPVVRTSLQDELLRLQAELRKTIVFVTHDIDEAIKLGDRVAVLRVGGRLAQLDAPARLLAEPADDFVREFLGRDRGIRRLSFVPSGDLPLRTDLTVPVSSAAASARAAAEPWLAVVDDGGRPLGWISPRGLPDSGAPADVRPEPYGTFVRGRDPLRSVLDAALLSPSGHAIAVDESGRVEGVVTREALDAALARAAGDARG
ncbi:proline/glycine betaine ABC transporter ATP-binding protein [Planomonospora parontospora subsp. antibiotica]|nr:proline/glycine betaine ABC transporter ATP-binding protein [Planomonospora parontospora subsp. antibiotica]